MNENKLMVAQILTSNPEEITINYFGGRHILGDTLVAARHEVK
jgi:hypothetical protein